LDDRRIDTLPAHHRNAGMVFQNYAIFPNLTVEGNVAYGLRARKVNRGDIRARVEKALERVRLPGYGPRWPHQLSGGQLQRVAIARVLVIEPAVLLFDEPLSNLDAQLRTQMRVEIRQLQQSLGLTAVYVTHDQEEALGISDRIAILRSGKIEQIGSPEEIYQRPQTAFVAEFLGGTNMLPGVAGRFDGHSTEVASCGTTISVFRTTIVFGALALLVLFLLYPLSLVLDASLRVNGTGTLTLANYAHIFASKYYVNSIANSLLAAAFATVGATLIGTLLAFC